MAYDLYLAERIRIILKEKKIKSSEIAMMGGLAFMVDDKMCIGVIKDELMARIGPDAFEEALKKPGCEAMKFTGRPMKGFVTISPEHIDMQDDLEYWINLCLIYNPIAKSSKKKGKK